MSARPVAARDSQDTDERVLFPRLNNIAGGWNLGDLQPHRAKMVTSARDGHKLRLATRNNRLQGQWI